MAGLIPDNDVDRIDFGQGNPFYIPGPTPVLKAAIGIQVLRVVHHPDNHGLGLRWNIQETFDLFLILFTLQWLYNVINAVNLRGLRAFTSPRSTAKLRLTTLVDDIFDLDLLAQPPQAAGAEPNLQHIIAGIEGLQRTDPEKYRRIQRLTFHLSGLILPTLQQLRVQARNSDNTEDRRRIFAQFRGVLIAFLNKMNPLILKRCIGVRIPTPDGIDFAIQRPISTDPAGTLESLLIDLMVTSTSNSHLRDFMRGIFGIENLRSQWLIEMEETFLTNGYDEYEPRHREENRRTDALTILRCQNLCMITRGGDDTGFCPVM